MDRRTIEATIYGTLFAFGGAAMIGSFALPDSSPYFQILLVAGLLALQLALSALFIFGGLRQGARKRRLHQTSNKAQLESI
ncbi:MAG: hypothetical protein IPM41_11590 [Sphingomonadales bacterium]|nr:hypothetical protein [Sphingomonadales bacterium]